MNPAILAYHQKQTEEDQKICEKLAQIILEELSEAENKIWHSHPVWFLEGNPIVGYSKEKIGIRLMFWSGADFEDDRLKPGTGKFKDASIFYNFVEEIEEMDLRNWLKKSREIQWDYKNIVKKKGLLERLK
ncbi:hypothetical protein FHS59_000896 [Algoriphagus iocasae]|uniref:YdhG-like domain-containing protein n=1 Tax=Algoriphagus iocasae TaxID=1836499 RepID=A0A841MTE8_9BACT|nr:DUF1801 domain-containing protein [Algoriphagus iocasae]MBB6325281.1 hypothetical protein [Algoriphagus iocasae]